MYLWNRSVLAAALVQAEERRTSIDPVKLMAGDPGHCQLAQEDFSLFLKALACTNQLALPWGTRHLIAVESAAEDVMFIFLAFCKFMWAHGVRHNKLVRERCTLLTVPVLEQLLVFGAQA